MGEEDQDALKAQLAAIRAISGVSRGSIKKVFDENGQALILALLGKEQSVQVLNKVMFFAMRLIEECELHNDDYPDAKGLPRADVISRLSSISGSLKEKEIGDIEGIENRTELLRLLNES